MAARLEVIFILSALVLQNILVVFTTKYSLRSAAQPYSLTSVVLASEVLKLLVCALNVVYFGGVIKVLSTLGAGVRQLELGVPAFMYVVQNNLNMYALRGLSPPVFVACNQTKIFATALFGKMILQTGVGRRQMQSLFLLMVGMIVLQLPDEHSVKHESMTHVKYLYGLLSATGAAFSSGFTGVYLEKLFKNSSENIWERNMQLALFSTPFALIVFIFDKNPVVLCSFCGFNRVVIFLVVLQAVGGLLIGLIMLKASALLKCFAVSISLCACALIDSSIKHQFVSSLSALGICCVCGASFLFSTASKV